MSKLFQLHPLQWVQENWFFKNWLHEASLPLIPETTGAVGGWRGVTLFLAPTVIPELHIKELPAHHKVKMTRLAPAMIVTPQTKEATKGHKNSQLQYHHVFTQETSWPFWPCYVFPLLLPMWVHSLRHPKVKSLTQCWWQWVNGQHSPTTLLPFSLFLSSISQNISGYPKIHLLRKSQQLHFHEANNRQAWGPKRAAEIFTCFVNI